ncbi:MAG: dihydrolipoamide acetyltransferase family protein, partial [Dehalococcoidia bacterium]
GESVAEGVIDRWLKKPGDRVEKYEPLVEVVTDKVNMEVPSPVSGTLLRILAQEGETVPMGAPIAEVETDEPVSERTAKAKTEPIGRTGVLLEETVPGGPTGAGVVEEIPSYSPVVRRLAQEHGIDLAQVRGTGLKGRVTKADVLRCIEARKGATAGVTEPAVQPTTTDEEALALTPIRRMIAEHMVRSVSQIPHAWAMVEVDVTNLVRLRETAKETFQQREGMDLTYLPFLMKTVAEALKEHPILNATWGGDRIILKRRFNIGIAVAAPEGLIVPVVHDADRLSIAGLAKACRDLTVRAREGKLRLEDVQGGTFTVNNTGALGSVVSQAIINYPQAGILTTEAIVKRPVVVEGDTIAIRHMMNVGLSFDHRVADGAQAAAFLQAVKGRLEAMGPDMPIY